MKKSYFIRNWLFLKCLIILIFSKLNISYFLLKLNIHNFKNNSTIKKEEKYKEYKFSSLQESYNKAKNFIDKNLNSILINDKNQFKYNNNPLVSVVIPIYNAQKFINISIRSIQNQDLLNIEIILINDYSSDNSLYAIERFQNEDPRIKIINNKKNMGIFYSRNIGALSAKGEFIFPLDNDDMFLNKDVLTTITNIAKEGDFDIVEFKGIETWKKKNNKLISRIKNIPYANYKLNLVLFQPELSSFPIRPGKSIDRYKLITCHLWAKCIKTNIYKKGLNSIGKEKYSRFMIAWEDMIAMIFLFNTANSYKFVGKYGILHIRRFSSGYSLTKPIQMNLVPLYLVDIVLDFPKNTLKYKKLVINLIFIALNSKLLEKIYQSNFNKKIIFSCLDRFLNFSFISKEYKDLIINKTKSLKYLNY